MCLGLFFLLVGLLGLCPELSVSGGVNPCPKLNPAIPLLGICRDECHAHSQCPDNELCCRTGCNKLHCTDPNLYGPFGFRSPNSQSQSLRDAKHSGRGDHKSGPSPFQKRLPRHPLRLRSRFIFARGSSRDAKVHYKNNLHSQDN